MNNVEIGDGFFDSVFMNINDQVANFAATVAADPKLAKGFNAICHSQVHLILIYFFFCGSFSFSFSLFPSVCSGCFRFCPCSPSAKTLLLNFSFVLGWVDM